LRRIVHEIHSLEISVATRYEQHHLVVGRNRVEALFAHPALASVRVHIAAPGDPVRIIAPLDVVEPRSKGSGGGAFPGWMAPVNRQRGGDIHVLRGATVLAARLREAVEQAEVEGGSLRVSLGIAAADHTHGPVEHIVQMADRDLYQDKALRKASARNGDSAAA